MQILRDFFVILSLVDVFDKLLFLDANDNYQKN